MNFRRQETVRERIRDKIAASKKKGIWMGGSVPAGYDVKNRVLVINEEDAKTVRTLFRLYIEMGSVRKLWAEARRLGLTTPVRTTLKGRVTGGKPFFPGNIYQLLSSPIYIGKLPHKGQVYDGNHPPLIDIGQWEAVQAGIAANRVDRRYGRNTRHPSPLTGLLYDASGMRFTPTQTKKKSGQPYRYYVDPALTTGVVPANANLPRIPALEIEHAVRKGLAQFLCDVRPLLGALGLEMKGKTAEGAIARAREVGEDILAATPMTWMPLIRPAIDRIVLREDAITFAIVPDGLREILSDAAETAANTGVISGRRQDRQPFEYRVPANVRLTRRGALKLAVGNEPAVSAGPDPALVKLVAKAHGWVEQLAAGRANSVREIATSEGITESYVTRVLRLGFLAPMIVHAILEGRQSAGVSADRLLLRDDLPLVWADQRPAFCQ